VDGLLKNHMNFFSENSSAENEVNAEAAAFKEKRTQKKGESWADLLKFAVIALIIVVPIRMFIAKPFVVSGSSMVPTFENGDYLIVDQLTYKFEDPARGDVVIFRYPNDRTKFYIKRIIGLPGDTIKSEDGKVIIYNKHYPDGLFLDEPYLENISLDNFTVTLREKYFVMGDNRPQSSDSREWGPLEESYIIGRPVLRLHPVQNINFFPGEYHFIDSPQQ